MGINVVTVFAICDAIGVKNKEYCLLKIREIVSAHATFKKKKEAEKEAEKEEGQNLGDIEDVKRHSF